MWLTEFACPNPGGPPVKSLRYMVGCRLGAAQTSGLACVPAASFPEALPLALVCSAAWQARVQHLSAACNSQLGDPLMPGSGALCSTGWRCLQCLLLQTLRTMTAARLCRPPSQLCALLADPPPAGPGAAHA